MITFLKSRGLVAKITLTIAAILIIPVAVVCLFYYGSYKKSLLKDAQNRLEVQLEELEYTTQANLDSIEAVIAELNYHQEFSYFLDEKSRLSDREIRYYLSNMEEEMIRIRYLYPNQFYQIVVYSSNTQIPSNDSWQFDMKTLKNKDYYDEIEKADQDIVYGRVRQADFLTSILNIDNLNVVKDGKTILPVYLKIRNLSTREIVGVLEIDMTLEKLTGERSLMEQDGEWEYLVFDPGGRLLYQNGQLKAGDILHTDFGENRGVQELNVSGETYLMAYSRLERSGLVQAVAVEKKSVLKFASEMMLRVVLVALVCGCCVIAFTYLVMRRLLNRLVVLDDMMAQVETGKFDIAIENEGVNDEISRIIIRFNQMASHLQNVINAAVEKEKAQKEAELCALQAQINPHFLYNTLENMRMQCEADGYSAIGDSLSALGDLFRYSIKWGSHEVPFHMEWENLENYLAIMNMRYEDDVKCILEMGEGIGDVIVPKMLLQPLVENSFSHGFKEVLPPWLVIVRAFRKQDKLVIMIEDNGSGIEKNRLEEIRSCLRTNQTLTGDGKKQRSIGIINVRQRLERICGEGSSIDIDSEPGHGVRILIQISMEEE